MSLEWVSTREEAADAGGSDAEGAGCPGEGRVSWSSGSPVE